MMRTCRVYGGMKANREENELHFRLRVMMRTCRVYGGMEANREEKELHSDCA